MALLALSLLLCVPILVWCLKLLQAIWWKPRMIEKKLKRQGIHVLPYKLLVGNIKEMNKLASEARSKPMELSHDIATLLNPMLQKLAMTYKKPIAIWHGTVPCVVIMNPKLIKDIMTRKFEFQKPEVSPTMKFFLKGLSNIDGDKWAMHRKIINPAFHMEKLKGMLPSFMVCCEEMVEKWDKLLSSANSCELDVLPEFQNLTGDIISRAAFGSNLEEGRLIFSLQREQGKLLEQSIFNFNSLWSRLLPSKLKELKEKMMQNHQQVRALLQGLIETREKAILSGNEYQNDLLNLLLKSNFNEAQESPNLGMSREDVIEECKLFYFAGHETTANLLTWTMIVLSMHLNWQEKARQEVLDLVGKNKPTFDELNRMKIARMILFEVLRLYPPTSVVRSIPKETQLGEYSLPAGVNLTIPLYLVQRDPELWGENAMEFNPERFSDGFTKPFFSFGWGPRICIGQNFAMLEAKLALAMILQHFSFELSPTYRHAPYVALTLQPQFGAQIVLSKI
ncbi:hypothetical protein P3X46_012349 [Hevea brasiliensis]|uniref:Cytochrome P450 n=1 Tax=Hevea brasiliensis TaxID=3981 RepID=A0ABQ9M9X6_HEVBR|nr:cytochrome P450 CYP72A616 [Hevea brasiliensis]KAJ9177097.1 hypothetical protein P3X46_012349 [Hevea brasiliensis]